MSNLDILAEKTISAKDFYADFMEPCVDARVLVIGQTVIRVYEVSLSGVFEGLIVFDVEDDNFPNFYIPECEEVVSVTLQKSRIQDANVGDVVVRGDSLWTIKLIEKLVNGRLEFEIDSLDEHTSALITHDPMSRIEIVR